MSQSTVLLEKNDGIATVTLNAPQRLNALSFQMLDELNRVLDDCTADPELRALVLTGTGRGFCAGADLSQGSTPSETGDERKKRLGRIMKESFNPAIKKLINLPFPTVAAVNGVAAGGGYGIALACDLVLAAKSARFVLVFTPQLGLIPDLGASWHAPRALGRARAIATAFFGDRMSATDAEEAGLIWRCVPDDELMTEVSRVVEKLKRGPTKAYPAVRRAFDAASTQTLPEQLDLEAQEQPALLATEDFTEGVRAFMQKREPEFKGR
ncbi:MAG: enoyl-CoA hydratase [Deltaproteobacteria bacterium]|nr:enoyl-CoA hydratase [Deltaproteobacteria bacterium]